ncbi:hypothetical protein [Rhodopirellula sp. MGV]|uniref:hypothetical protein n=1 Tax=Rhodopirellula sp. MGV TaxID=2023130 RepID=UPI000B975E35|nr:hypothetical protein [Rhodopirellula sp. MGV]OYP38901.1 hypothetical protein CGZ80_01390 [Rhodopirellula sp. MGV]PNY38285.1 hypothetical protein C2E31_02945 [Rhodopirellula baltica]
MNAPNDKRETPSFEEIDQQLDFMALVLGAPDFERLSGEQLCVWVNRMIDEILPSVEMASNRMTRIHSRAGSIMDRLIEAQETALRSQGGDRDAKR